MLCEVDSLPYRLGFVETAELQVTHGEIVAATLAGNNADRLAALNRYLDGGEALAEKSDGPHAQIGLIVAQALIWRDAGEPVRYLRAVLSAFEYADNMDLDDIAAALNAEAVAAGGSGELLQAQGDFDGAVGAYVDLEQTDLEDTERGLLNLRLAECYQELILEGAADGAQLVDLRDLSLESAFGYLEGDPNQVKIQAFQETMGE